MPNNKPKTQTVKKNGLNKKYLKIGSFSLTMTAVVIAVVIVVNLFVGEIPSIYTSYDLSGMNLYEISEETEKILSLVDEDVTFYILSQKGGEDPYTLEMLNRYAAMNSHISVKTVDPAANPTFIEQYTTEALTNNSVIAVSEKRAYPVDYYEIYQVEYTEEEMYYYYYYGQMPQGTPYFCGELAFSTALDYVTREELPTMYTLTGHGEAELDHTYLSYIDAENIATASLTLLNIDAIPEDCSSILINNPASDISSMEYEMLKGYLAEGGNVILITGAINYSSAKMPNLTALAADMGLKPVNGVIYETNRSNYTMYSHYLLPNVGDTQYEPLSLLSNPSIYVFANASHGILPTGDGNIIPLLFTSGSAYVREDLSDNSPKKEDDYSGQVYVGAASTGEGDGTRSDTFKFVWYSSTGLTDSAADQMVSGGNSALFMATLSWMSDNPVNLSIVAKQLQVEALTVTQAEGNLWSAVVIFVVPLTVIAIGFVVWVRRRRK